MEEFVEILQKLNNELFRFIYKMIGNSDDAKDILQEVAEIGWKKWHQLHDIDSAKAWIYSIARNEIKKYYRKKHRAMELEARYMDDHFRLSEDIDSDRIALYEIMSKYTPLWKNILILNLIDGYSAREISEKTGLPNSMLSKRLTRMIKAIAEELYYEG